MRLTVKFLCGAVGFFALGGAAGSAQAGVISADYKYVGAPGTNTISVAQFDASKGALQSVIISYSLGLNFSGTFGNFSGSAGTGTANLVNGSSILKDASGQELVSLFDQGGTTTVAVPRSAGGPPGQANFAISVSPTTASLDPLTDGASLAAFTGSGRYNFSVVTDAGSTIDSTGNVQYFGGALTAVDFLTVTYNFADATSVPEPATMTLLAVGLVGAGMVRRRVR